MIAKRINPKIGIAIAMAIIMPKIPISAVVINLCIVFPFSLDGFYHEKKQKRKHFLYRYAISI